MINRLPKFRKTPFKFDLEEATINEKVKAKDTNNQKSIKAH